MFVPVAWETQCVTFVIVVGDAQCIVICYSTYHCWDCLLFNLSLLGLFVIQLIAAGIIQ